ncbi:MAG: class I SAM-dependent methyltransferase [Myxococcota bacterium]
MMTNPDATQRFSDRVADYVKYRPNYPDLLLTHLAEAGGKDVADVGSGTGILTAGLLERFETVYAIEPNADMRAAAEHALAEVPGFISLDARAEKTGLPERSVDLVCAAQAFHWFAPVATRAEFERILRPGGMIALIWNDRQTDITPFLEGYEAALQTWNTDDNKVNHRNAEARVEDFFQGMPHGIQEFKNEQRLDEDGLLGRIRSSSYTPPPGHPDHTPMMNAFAELFDRHQREGVVRILYVTRLYWGRP